MSANAEFVFDDVAIVSLVACSAPEIVTSADIDRRLAGFYERVGARPGLLQDLAGIEERRHWPVGFSFMDAAALAGERAIDEAGIDRDRIGLLIDTSVCRERLEPSSAVTVHHLLRLGSHCVNFDLGNACLGFLNGIHLGATMLATGQIDYALIVDGEGTREIYENTLVRLEDENATHGDLFENFASLTLGSGSTAVVLGRSSQNPGAHRIDRATIRAATEHHELCVGSLERMRTETRALLEAGTELVQTLWDDADSRGWLEMDRYILHQVSRVHTDTIIKTIGLDPLLVPLTFPMFGNMGPAAIPSTLASVADTLEAGDRVLCMGIGSGLNASVLELTW